MNTSLQSQLTSLYGDYILNEQQAKQRKQDDYRFHFEKKVLEAKRTLIDDVKAAASKGRTYLELVGGSNGVYVGHFVDMARVGCIDRSKVSTIGNGEWRSVNRYCDKDVLRNDVFIGLWEHIEELGLKPIFIEGEYGNAIFGVEFIHNE